MKRKSKKPVAAKAGAKMRTKAAPAADVGPRAAPGTEPEAKGAKAPGTAGAGEKADAGKAKAPATPKAPKRISGLDAAVMILQAHQNKPMSPAEITEKARAKGLWNPGGKTPAATLSSALFREIKNGGKDCRFEKVGRGQFALADKKDA